VFLSIEAYLVGKIPIQNFLTGIETRKSSFYRDLKPKRLRNTVLGYFLGWYFEMQITISNNVLIFNTHGGIMGNLLSFYCQIVSCSRKHLIVFTYLILLVMKYCWFSGIMLASQTGFDSKKMIFFVFNDTTRFVYDSMLIHFWQILFYNYQMATIDQWRGKLKSFDLQNHSKKLGLQRTTPTSKKGLNYLYRVYPGFWQAYLGSGDLVLDSCRFQVITKPAKNYTSNKKG